MRAPVLVRLVPGLLLAALVVMAPLGAGLPTAMADDRYEIKVSEMEMVELLETVRNTTGHAMVWNPQDKNIRGKRVTGGTTFQGTAEEVFSDFRAFLTFYELVVVPLGSKKNPTYAVVDARQTSSIMKLKPLNVELNEGNLADYEDKDGLFLTTTILVEHMDELRNARNALTRIVTGSNIGNVTEVPNAKAFVVTDFAPNVCAIYRLLKRMDRPSLAASTTAGTTVAIDLEHAAAPDAASSLVALFSRPTPAARNTRAQTPVPPTPTAPRIVADGRTNRLLVTGSAEEIKRVREAVALIDIPVRVASTRVHFISLKHIRANQASAALMALVGSSPGLWRGGRGDPMPSIVSHEESNALLVSATKAHAESVLALIAEMDQPGK